MTDLTIIPNLTEARARLWRNVRIIEFAQDYPGTMGRAVRAKRQALGMTQAELSRKTSIGKQHISDIENYPTSGLATFIHGIPALVSILGLTIDDLIEQTEEEAA